jgi:hypothetical protein
MSTQHSPEAFDSGANVWQVPTPTEDQAMAEFETDLAFCTDVPTTPTASLERLKVLDGRMHFIHPDSGTPQMGLFVQPTLLGSPYSLKKVRVIEAHWAAEQLIIEDAVLDLSKGQLAEQAFAWQAEPEQSPKSGPRIFDLLDLDAQVKVEEGKSYKAGLPEVVRTSMSQDVERVRRITLLLNGYLFGQVHPLQAEYVDGDTQDPIYRRSFKAAA